MITGSLDLPRLRLAATPTPVQRADQLAVALGLGQGRLWVKRDDLTGLAGGGTKARRFEYLCADALHHGCDTLVTGGGEQSNHVRLAAAAAGRVGLRCVLVMGAERPSRPQGNVLLAHLAGARFVWLGEVGQDATERAVGAVAAAEEADGARPYAVPINGPGSVADLGSVALAAELHEQLGDVDRVVLAFATGSTMAGLAVGIGSFDRLHGIDTGVQADPLEAVGAKAVRIAALAGRPRPDGRPHIDRSQVGAGYDDPPPAAEAAITLAARTEGLVLDPIYTARAVAGLGDAVRRGAIDPDERIVLLHTGGQPALFTVRNERW